MKVTESGNSRYVQGEGLRRGCDGATLPRHTLPTNPPKKKKIKKKTTTKKKKKKKREKFGLSPFRLGHCHSGRKPEKEKV